MASQDLQTLARLVRTRAQLLRDGISERDITQLVRDGSVIRLSRGLYASGQTLEKFSAEDRHVVTVFASARTMRREYPFASHSAAALHGLPLFHFENARPQVLIPNRANSSSNRMVERRVATCQESDLTLLEGVRCTNLERTVLDMARLDTPERAIACADAAIRLRFPIRRGHASSDRAVAWRDDLLGRLSTMPGSRGVRRAAEVIQCADGSADSPLESVARWRFLSRGYQVDTQVAVAGPSGKTYVVDLELLGLGVLCEVDGKSKYTDSNLRNDQTPAEVVYAEKQRADWIEGTTGKRIVRLGYKELVTNAAFAEWLRAFHVPQP